MKEKSFRVFRFPDDLLKDNLTLDCECQEIERTEFAKNKEQYADSIFLVRGITNHKYFKFMKEVNSKYVYFDTGYFGNLNSYYHPTSFKKVFHRAVFDNLQLNKILNVEEDRYYKTLKYIKRDFGCTESDILKPWKRDGKKILLCPPSDKSAKILGLNMHTWLDETIEEIKKYSKREIIVRKKHDSREARIHDPIQKALDNNIFILVTYNSIAATEAVIHGIPALTLGVNAASSMSINSISKIENPIYPDRRLWMHNLAYGQFHLDEMKDGTAWKIIKQSFGK